MMIDLYHRTTPEAVALILATGRMVSRENTGEAYFSTVADGHAAGYGEALVHVRVPTEWTELDDEFPDGEQHYRVKVSLLRGQHFVIEQP